MRRWYLVLVAVGCWPVVAHANDARDCHSIVAPVSRLACYDTATGRPGGEAPASPDQMIGQWRYTPAVDRMNDRRFYNAVLRPISGSDDLVLRLQCSGFLFVSFFSRAFSGFLRHESVLTYRVGSAASVRPQEVSYGDNRVDLMDQSATRLLSLLGSEERLIVRFQGPNSHHFREAEFDTSGFRETMRRLREHCPESPRRPAP